MSATLEPVASQEVRPRVDRGADLEAVFKREFRRARVRGGALLVVVYVLASVGFGVATLLGAPMDLWGVALLAIVVTMGPLSAGFTWLLMRGRLLPGLQVLSWANGSITPAWTELDAGEPPTTTDEAIARLDGRHDDPAIAMRAAWLASEERTADLRPELDRWVPVEPVSIAQKARLASTLAWLEGTVDDLGPAWDAATAIADPVIQHEQQARVLLADANRLVEAGEDPFPRLVEAHRLLGDRATEFDSDGYRQALRRLRLMVVAWGLAPIAIWSAILFIGRLFA